MGRAVGWEWGSGFLLGGDLGVRVGVWGGFGQRGLRWGWGVGLLGGVWEEMGGRGCCRVG